MKKGIKKTLIVAMLFCSMTKVTYAEEMKINQFVVFNTNETKDIRAKNLMKKYYEAEKRNSSIASLFLQELRALIMGDVSYTPEAIGYYMNLARK